MGRVACATAPKSIFTFLCWQHHMHAIHASGSADPCMFVHRIHQHSSNASSSPLPKRGGVRRTKCIHHPYPNQAIPMVTPHRGLTLSRTRSTYLWMCGFTNSRDILELVKSNMAGGSLHSICLRCAGGEEQGQHPAAHHGRLWLLRQAVRRGAQEI